MRILHIICSVNPAHGGPVEGVKQLGAVNRRAGHVVEVATLDAPSEPWIKEFPMPLHCFGPSVGKYHYTPRLVPWLRAHVRDYDAFVVNGLWQYNSYGAYQALHNTSAPYYIYPHGMLDPWFQRTYPLKHLKKTIYWKFFQHRVVANARAVLFTCEEEMRLARNAFQPYRCREIVVNYGTSAPKGDPAAQREAFLLKFPEARGKRCILFISRIHEKKGCDLLIRAFHRALLEFPAESERFRLIMAGPDQTGWAASLKELAGSLGLANKIIWTGMVSGDLKWGAFYASEVFALPSHQENFGIVVAEALACGIPVLISDQVNIWREIKRDDVGFVENDNQEGTDRLLRQWFSLDAAARERMAQRARPCFDQRFEIHQAARSMIEAISSTSSLPAQPVAAA